MVSILVEPLACGELRQQPCGTVHTFSINTSTFRFRAEATLQNIDDFFARFLKTETVINFYLEGEKYFERDLVMMGLSGNALVNLSNLGVLVCLVMSCSSWGGGGTM
jgi:hypothetical protein